MRTREHQGLGKHRFEKQRQISGCRCPESLTTGVKHHSQGSVCITGLPCSRWQTADNEWMRQMSQIKKREGLKVFISHCLAVRRATSDLHASVGEEKKC
ncbi:hypothetical protein JOB18_009324 [Solea senegalensis]|uniref:Uncharacterized protein n=1 Tax=Solea senegalensis TaxID=28829 RepID=A0AAV6Q115_SOLSE|nr:hypothetical protein JOB18_009324 [Solea senegalensis]